VSAPVVLLDTDVASAFFKRKPLPIFVRLAGWDSMVSFVTRAEMKKWAKVRSWAPRNIEVLDAWLDSMPTIHSSDSVTEIWADLSADGHLRGQHRPQNDTWVAAVALAHGLPLATLNFKDYADIEANHGLRLIRPRPGESW
jgi:toxin FitB